MKKYRICWNFNNQKGSTPYYTQEEWSNQGMQLNEHISWLRELYGKKSHWIDEMGS